MKILTLLSFLAISAAEVDLARTNLDSRKGPSPEYNPANVERVPKYRRSLRIGGFDPVYSTSGYSGNIISGFPTQQNPTTNQNLFEYQSSSQNLPLSTVPQTLNFQFTNPSTLNYPSSTITTIPNNLNNLISNPTQLLQSNLRFNTGAQLTIPQQSFNTNTVTQQIQPFQSFVPNDFSTITTQTQPIQNFLPNDFSTITTQTQPIQNFLQNDFSTITTQSQPIQNFVPNDFSIVTNPIKSIQSFSPNEFLSGFTGTEISNKPSVFKPLDISQILRSLH